MATSDCPTLTLLQTAFGPSATLYSVLQCNKSSTSCELKRAYRGKALQYHPDRAEKNNDSSSSSSTMKFQAVSAAYQILMNERRRSVYDNTGQILDEDDEDDNSTTSHNNSTSTSTTAHTQREWEQFFHSIFNEIISTGVNHTSAASTYRGSDVERRDVLHYYTMCKGDMNKIVECIIHGSSSDVVRWKKEIIDPAVSRGEVDDFSVNGICDDEKNQNVKCEKKRRTILETSSEEDEVVVSKKKKLGQKKRQRKHNASLLVDTDEEDNNESSPEKDKSKHNTLLVDTDDDDDESPKKRSSTTTNNNISMSKRNKMDYRVAKKRKAKAKKEMEMADIIRSKNWDASSSVFCSASSQGARNKNMGNISDSLLNNIERKYGGSKNKRKL